MFDYNQNHVKTNLNFLDDCLLRKLEVLQLEVGGRHRQKIVVFAKHFVETRSFSLTFYCTALLIIFPHEIKA